MALGHAEDYEEELSRFIVEGDGEIHPVEEWYGIWQEDEKWIRVLSIILEMGLSFLGTPNLTRVCNRGS